MSIEFYIDPPLLGPVDRIGSRRADVGACGFGAHRGRSTSRYDDHASAPDLDGAMGGSISGAGDAEINVGLGGIQPNWLWFDD